MTANPGPRHRDIIYQAVHSYVKSAHNLGTIMSRRVEFVHCGGGLWRLSSLDFEIG